jgi:MFS family permease
MDRDRVHFLFLNLGHFLDHLFTLIFATVAALALVREWDVGYADLLRYATPGFFALGLFAYPSGWLADRWSQEGMMVVYFLGAGVSAVATGLAQTPLQVGIGLCVIGMFAAIYHPVGLAIVTRKWRNIGMRIAVNNVWGNLGVASAALITGFLIDSAGWRTAFVAPGVLSVALGVAYLVTQWDELRAPASSHPSAKAAGPRGGAGQDATREQEATRKAMLVRVSLIVFGTTALANLVFQATTFALPKIFDERLQRLTAEFVAWLQATPLGGHAEVATMVGVFAFAVFAVSSLSQIVVGWLLDRLEPRSIFVATALVQAIFFALMVGATDGVALVAALGFMIGVFGQGPINDFLISRVATGAMRARMYGARFVLAFTVIAATLPLISFIYERWGFDMLFHVLTVNAVAILALVACLPRKLPAAE